MRILFIAEFFPTDTSLVFTGGVEAYNFFLVKELSKKHEVTVICRKQNETKDIWKFEVIRLGSKNPIISTSFFSIPQRFWFLAQALNVGLKQEFDVVQGNNFVVYPITFIVGLFKKKPTIAWYADVFLGQWLKHAGFLSGIIGHLIETVILKLHWSHIVALSRSTAKKLRKTGIKSDKMTIIPAGIDLDYFKSAKNSKNRVVTIISVARLVRYKRIDLLIEACQILKLKNLKFKLEIIGDGPEKEKIYSLINKFDLFENISLSSGITRLELAKKLKAAHIFCHPSEQEGFGMVVLEACACNLPFVISNIDTLIEITHKGQGGLIFKKGDKLDLSKKLESLINNPNLRNKLSRESYRLAKEYSWEKVATQFSEVYEKI